MFVSSTNHLNHYSSKPSLYVIKRHKGKLFHPQRHHKEIMVSYRRNKIKGDIYFYRDIIKLSIEFITKIYRAAKYGNEKDAKKSKCSLDVVL